MKQFPARPAAMPARATRLRTAALGAMATLAAATLLALAPGRSAQAADLTPLEQRWLTGMWPVIQHAKQQALPLDIVVQPQDAPEAAPLALGYLHGRCKLVLSLRGNPEGEATLARLPAGLEAGALELMAAHELGHCRRYLDGQWHGLPAGFSPAPPPEGLSAELRQAYDSMQSTRREEGFGDLVGLAWVRQQRPQQYAALHAWLLAERSRELLPGSHHDTLAWLRLARDPAALGPTGGGLFEAAKPLWVAGLALPE